MTKKVGIISKQKHLFYMLASALVFLMLLITCKSDENEHDKNADPDIFALDISKETDWNYMVVGKDGSSVFISVNELNNIPTRMFLKPDKNSDDGFTILFKENGLPDKMINKGHILYFGNFNGYKFDLAIIYPNNRIEYFYDIETDINFDAYNERSVTGHGRSILSDFFDSLGFSGHALGISTCVASIFYPPALLGCASYVVSEIGHVVVDKVFDGYTADLAHTIINAFGCAGGGISGALDCVAALGGTASLLSYLDFNLTTQKTTQINEAIRRIDGDGLTIIPHDLLKELLSLGIEVNNGNKPPNIEGKYLISPDVLIRSNFNDSYSPGHRFDNMDLSFSNQNNTKMTVDVAFFRDNAATGSGLNSFITGNENKFSVFMDNNGTYNEHPVKSVEIFSGEITSSGIKNFYGALIITMDAPGTIKRGQGRLYYDSDGFSEKVSSARASLVIPRQSMNATSSEVLLTDIYSE